jgi:hypothetical protein
MPTGLGFLVSLLGLVVLLLAYKERADLAASKKAEEEKQPSCDE